MDTEQTLKAFIRTQKPITEEQNMIAKDSLAPTFGCELTVDDQKQTGPAYLDKFEDNRKKYSLGEYRQAFGNRSSIHQQR